MTPELFLNFHIFLLRISIKFFAAGLCKGYLARVHAYDNKMETNPPLKGNAHKNIIQYFDIQINTHTEM